MLLVHAHPETLDQPTLLAESARHPRDRAGVGEGTDELLRGEGVAPEERLAALAGDGVEVQAERLVATDHTDLGGTTTVACCGRRHGDRHSGQDDDTLSRVRINM